MKPVAQHTSSPSLLTVVGSKSDEFTKAQQLQHGSGSGVVTGDRSGQSADTADVNLQSTAQANHNRHPASLSQDSQQLSAGAFGSSHVMSSPQVAPRRDSVGAATHYGSATDSLGAATHYEVPRRDSLGAATHYEDPTKLMPQTPYNSRPPVHVTPSQTAKQSPLPFVLPSDLESKHSQHMAGNTHVHSNGVLGQQIPTHQQSSQPPQINAQIEEMAKLRQKIMSYLN